MRFGCCSDLISENLCAVKQEGYDYVECSATALAALEDQEYEAFKTLLGGFPCEACNLFFPQGVALLGPKRDDALLFAHARKVLMRMKGIGGKKVVFGSGYARNLPDDCDHEAEIQSFILFLRKLGDIAQEYGIVIAMEPLNFQETNFINTTSQGYEIVKQTNHPHIRLLADLYHMYVQKENVQNLLTYKDVLVHFHIAEPTKRKIPSLADSYDYHGFLNVIRQIDEHATVSIEAGAENFAAEVHEGLCVLHQNSGK